MEVTLALLADSANVSREGKLNILGTFSTILATQFPARHPQMQLVIRMEASAGEVGMHKALVVKLMDEDANEVGKNRPIDIEVPPPSAPGQRTEVNVIAQLVDTVFPKPGRYVFHILIDDRTEREVPLTVGG